MSRRSRLLARCRRILRSIERQEAILRRPLTLYREMHDRDVEQIVICHRNHSRGFWLFWRASRNGGRRG